MCKEWHTRHIETDAVGRLFWTFGVEVDHVIEVYAMALIGYGFDWGVRQRWEDVLYTHVGAEGEVWLLRGDLTLEQVFSVQQHVGGIMHCRLIGGEPMVAISIGQRQALDCLARAFCLSTLDRLRLT